MTEAPVPPIMKGSRPLLPVQCVSSIAPCSSFYFCPFSLAVSSVSTGSTSSTHCVLPLISNFSLFSSPSFHPTSHHRTERKEVCNAFSDRIEQNRLETLGTHQIFAESAFFFFKKKNFAIKIHTEVVDI